MKGIFCLEGFWYGDHRDKTSISPVLDLINKYKKVPFIHHRCSTLSEFEFSISRWKTKSFHQKYPLLYLSFHGEPGKILVGKEFITLDALAEMLEDKCEGVVIHFGCCSTLYEDERRLQAFMERTRSVAVIGYKKPVDWLPSTAFEIMLLDALTEQPFDSRGVDKIYKDITEDCGSQAKKLAFRFVINKKLHFPRRRNKKL